MIASGGMGSGLAQCPAECHLQGGGIVYSFHHLVHTDVTPFSRFVCETSQAPRIPRLDSDTPGATS